MTQILGVLSDRMVMLEGQMTEALGRIRVIGERLAGHTHPEGASIGAMLGTSGEAARQRYGKRQ